MRFEHDARARQIVIVLSISISNALLRYSYKNFIDTLRNSY